MSPIKTLCILLLALGTLCLRAQNPGNCLLWLRGTQHRLPVAYPTSYGNEVRTLRDTLPFINRCSTSLVVAKVLQSGSQFRVTETVQPGDTGYVYFEEQIYFEYLWELEREYSVSIQWAGGASQQETALRPAPASRHPDAVRVCISCAFHSNADADCVSMTGRV